MGKYLVTGAAGFIGSHLAEKLVSDGHTVVGADCFTDYYPRVLKEQNVAAVARSSAFAFLETDLAEADLGTLLEDVDGVFHLAAQPGVRGSWGDSFTIYLRDNVRVTQRIFDAASRRGIRVVYASSSSVYGNAESYPTPENTAPLPVSPYGITKLTCEHLARAFSPSGLDAVGLRYFTVYGPRQRPDMAFTRIGRALLSGNTFTVFGTGQQTRDVTYVSDAVAATCAAMERGTTGVVYNVGGGSETSLADAIAMFEELAERKLNAEYADVARGDVTRTVSDCAALASDTEWTAKTDLRLGLSQHLEWCRRTAPD